MRLQGTCITAVLFFSLQTFAATADEPVSLRSPTRRFIVTCPDGGQAVNMSRWADDVMTKLEHATRSRFDFRDREFRIRVFVEPDSASCRLGFSERVSDGKVVQELLIENPGKVDWEDVLELHCSLLLNGQLGVPRLSGDTMRQRPFERLPAWLVVGLSHVIDPVIKSRDRRITLNWRKKGGFPPFAEVLKWHVLPSGRAREKAACTLAVSWILSIRDPDEWFATLQDRVRVGGGLTDQWMITQIPGCRTMDDVERLWSARLDNERMVISDPGQVLPDALDLIKDQLVVRPGEGGVPAETNLPPVIELGSLVGMKKQKWIRPLCNQRSAAIRMAAVSGSTEVREVGEAYGAFMDALGEGSRDSKLRSLLSRANGLITSLEDITRKREAYLNEAERRHAGAESARGNCDDLSADRLERSRLQTYIDKVEQDNPGHGADAAMPVVTEEGIK